MAQLGRQFTESLNLPELQSELRRFASRISDWEAHTNIEALLTELLRLQADKQEPPVVNRTAAILGFEAKKHILRVLSRRPKNTEYLKGLRRWIGRGTPLDVFTLNYDTVIETWCRKRRISWTDGCLSVGEWTPSTLIDGDFELRLWKLHGSVTWLHQAESIRQAGPLGNWREELRSGEARSRTLDAAVIYPAASKKAFDVLAWLQRAFADSLAGTSVLACIGYGFADAHIAAIVGESLDRYAHLRVVICDLKPERPFANLRAHVSDRAAARIATVAASCGGGLARELPRALDSLETTSLPQPPSAMERQAPSMAGSTANRELHKDQLVAPGHFGAATCAGHDIVALRRIEQRDWELLRLNPANGHVDRLCSGFHDPRGIAVQGRRAFVVDANILGRLMGIGGIWQIDLDSGEKRVYIGSIRPHFGAMKALLSSKRERGHDLLTFGFFYWPTAIAASGKDLIVTESRRLVAIDASAKLDPVTPPTFLNLNGVAHWRAQEFLLTEHVLGAARVDDAAVGMVWAVDLKAGSSPRPIAGGFSNIRALALDSERDDAYFVEVHQAGGRIIKLYLRSGRHEQLPRTYPGKPNLAYIGERKLLVSSCEGLFLRSL